MCDLQTLIPCGYTVIWENFMWNFFLCKIFCVKIFCGLWQATIIKHTKCTCILYTNICAFIFVVCLPHRNLLTMSISQITVRVLCKKLPFKRRSQFDYHSTWQNFSRKLLLTCIVSWSVICGHTFLMYMFWTVIHNGTPIIQTLSSRSMHKCMFCQKLPSQSMHKCVFWYISLYIILIIQ